jgi:hypothetical protein
MMSKRELRESRVSELPSTLRRRKMTRKKVERQQCMRTKGKQTAPKLVFPQNQHHSLQIVARRLHSTPQLPYCLYSLERAHWQIAPHSSYVTISQLIYRQQTHALRWDGAGAGRKPPQRGCVASGLGVTGSAMVRSRAGKNGEVFDKGRIEDVKVPSWEALKG